MRRSTRSRRTSLSALTSSPMRFRTAARIESFLPSGPASTTRMREAMSSTSAAITSRTARESGRLADWPNAIVWPCKAAIDVPRTAFSLITCISGRARARIACSVPVASNPHAGAVPRSYPSARQNALAVSSWRAPDLRKFAMFSGVTRSHDVHKNPLPSASRSCGYAMYTNGSRDVDGGAPEGAGDGDADVDVPGADAPGVDAVVDVDARDADVDAVVDVDARDAEVDEDVEPSDAAVDGEAASLETGVRGQ